MFEKDSIIEILKTKSANKQKVYRQTYTIFKDLCKLLKDKVDYLSGHMKEFDDSIELGYVEEGDFESHIFFSGDRLIFHMHTNVFDFPKSHSINKTQYVKEDNSRSFCGVINIYNFLNDSFNYNRMNDVGNLIARIYINKDLHFFVEGEKKLGFLFSDFEKQKLNSDSLIKIVDCSILFALDFDLITPKYEDVKFVTLHQILNMKNSHKLRTSKSLGFKFSYENK